MSEAPFDFCDARSASRTLLAARFSPPEVDDTTGLLSPAELAREVVVGHGGRIASLTDEGVLAEMISPTDTLQCAAALQDRFALERARLGPGVRLRTAVAAGEVVRQGRTLIGEPVHWVNRLAEKAEPGEVLFTHGVCLAMTRSEVRWELHTDSDPAVGQPVHRLLQLPGSSNPELPFGGVGLDRVGGTSRSGPPRRALSAAARATLTLFVAGIADALRGMVRAWAGPAVTSLLVAAFGVASITYLMPASHPHEIREAIVQGRPRAALQLAEKWTARSSDPAARAWHGAALAEVDRTEEAREVLAAALSESPRLAHSPAIARGAVLTLAGKGADRSLVVAHPTPAVERALLEAARSPRYWLRWNAIAALDKLGGGDRVDRVHAYTLDLQHAGSCGTKMRAARELAKLGDTRAVPALEEAKANGFPEAACNLKRVAEEALASLPHVDG